MSATIIVSTEDAAKTIGHGIRCSETVDTAIAAKPPPQISSSGGDMRRTVQNRKKCKTTNAMAIPNHRSAVIAYADATPPTIRTTTSSADRRNPGWNLRSGMKGKERKRDHHSFRN